MKRRELVLDFTSLLDIVLIILFFFIIFSHLEVSGGKAEAEAQMTEATRLMEQANAKAEAADDKMAEAESMVIQLEEELAMVRKSDEQTAENLEAMLEFGRGQNIKMLLKMEDTSWSLTIFSGENLIATLGEDADLTDGIIDALSESGYVVEDTLFCEFILDGAQPGTASAYRMITKAIRNVRGTYCNLYYSETDISILEG